MGILSINTNLPSLNTRRQFNRSEASQLRAMTRLASGKRLNSASDDAAGVAISDRFTAQVRGLHQAIRNANDGVSLAQTAEGGLKEIVGILQRMRELAMQSVNDINTTADRATLDAEFIHLRSEVDDIANNTTFNGKLLLDGSASSMKFHVGANAGEVISVSISGARASDLSIDTLQLDSGTNANTAISGIDQAIASVDTIRGDLGATMNRFQSVISTLLIGVDSHAEARSKIIDSDVAYETAELVRSNLLQQAGVAMLGQANQTANLALNLLG